MKIYKKVLDFMIDDWKDGFSKDESLERIGDAMGEEEDFAERNIDKLRARLNKMFNIQPEQEYPTVDDIADLFYQFLEVNDLPIDFTIEPCEETDGTIARITVLKTKVGD